MEEPVENRWKHPDECDLCGKVTSNPTWEHIYPPDFTFVWCKECQKDQAACNRKMEESVAEYRKWVNETKSAAGVREITAPARSELQDDNRSRSCFGWLFDWLKLGRR